MVVMEKGTQNGQSGLREMGNVSDPSNSRRKTGQRPFAALLLPQRGELFFTELSPPNDQGTLIKGVIRDRS